GFLAFRETSPDSKKEQLTRESAESLRPLSEIFPFSGDFRRRLFRPALIWRGVAPGAALLDGMFYRPVTGTNRTCCARERASASDHLSWRRLIEVTPDTTRRKET